MVVGRIKGKIISCVARDIVASPGNHSKGNPGALCGGYTMEALSNDPPTNTWREVKHGKKIRGNCIGATSGISGAGFCCVVNILSRMHVCVLVFPRRHVSAVVGHSRILL